MVKDYSLKSKLSMGTVYFVLFLFASACILPFLHIIAVSFSSSAPAAAGTIGLLPVDFTLKSWKEVMGYTDFWRAFSISVLRVTLGTSLNLFLIIITAYPLSRENRDFKARTVYVWIFFITTLLSGGLVPTYFVIARLGLINTIWALILPGALPVGNVILMLNFFRQIPKELEEAAFLDGAGYWKTLWTVMVPTSIPSIATITLFCLVGHWNSWFDGLLYMDSPANYPLQSYVQTIIVKIDTTQGLTAEMIENMLMMNERTIRAAVIIIAALPVLVIFPFFQKHLYKGIVIGSVKG